ncbi:hypothetical protein H1N72_gp32 [Lactococcus phage P596]|uniref:Uncharacterized protein n=1 Tax=Lactococcus phage P596 TaxID=2656515 RepID=A0A5Q2F827_9CAUD|nr:hypothetical protein H1N72_gp32 [Lactococcus phage P596]QGF21095.1 hypothetical protein [Lactococcus phage P596]
MKDIKKDYYANVHDIQLKDFWKQTNKQGYLNFCIMNAVKYGVRIGRKPDQESDDFVKFQDYARQAAELLEQPYQAVHDAVMQEIYNFNHWRGIENES